MFIRYLADTSALPPAGQALEYLQSLLRIAPVRLCSMSAGLSGKWVHYSALLATPMVGPFVNVVCCDPARWKWEQQLAVPQRNGKPETIRGTVELYTANVRNVLIVCHLPQDQEQIATARRYEQLIVPSEMFRMGWEYNGAPSAIVIPTPVTDLDAFRAAVIG